MVVVTVLFVEDFVFELRILSVYFSAEACSKQTAFIMKGNVPNSP